jgi:hypothetical protein
VFDARLDRGINDVAPLADFADDVAMLVVGRPRLRHAKDAVRPVECPSQGGAIEEVGV